MFFSFEVSGELFALESEDRAKALGIAGDFKDNVDTHPVMVIPLDLTLS